MRIVEDVVGVTLALGACPDHVSGKYTMLC